MPKITIYGIHLYEDHLVTWQSEKTISKHKSIYSHGFLDNYEDPHMFDLEHL